MNAPGNLADPAYEPSDEDLARLMKDAFDHVLGSHDESLRQMRARIQRLQVEARALFEAARPAAPDP